MSGLFWVGLLIVCACTFLSSGIGLVLLWARLSPDTLEYVQDLLGFGD